MQTLLVNKFEYLRSTYIPRTPTNVLDLNPRVFSMPDLSQTTPATFPLQGGLVLNKSTFAMQPGEALSLQNFEPDINVAIEE